MRYPDVLPPAVPRIGVDPRTGKKPPSLSDRPRRVNAYRPWETLAALRRGQAFRLRAHDELSYRQIARALGCSKTTAHRYVQGLVCLKR